MKTILQKLINQEDLSKEEASKAMTCIMTGEAGEAKTAAFLTALVIKGETGLEIEACARSMRKAAHKWPGVAPEILVDTCGTGGDGLSTINISTLAAVTLASLGVSVAKHGNRAVSSTTGSADILEALGLKLNLEPRQVSEQLEKTNMAFLFAPIWHPAMKHAVPVRKALGVRTIFNILGPLTNPAPITHQIIGVYDKNVMQSVAEALAGQGRIGAYVLHSEDGLDELSPSVPTNYIKIEKGVITGNGTLSPADFGFKELNRDDLVIKDRNEALERTNLILQGKGNVTENQTIAMNAALLLDLIETKDGLENTTDLCLKQITSGKLKTFTDSWG